MMMPRLPKLGQQLQSRVANRGGLDMNAGVCVCARLPVNEADVLYAQFVRRVAPTTQLSLHLLRFKDENHDHGRDR